MPRFVCCGQGKLKAYLDKLVVATEDKAEAAWAAGAEAVEAANAVDPFLQPDNPRFDPDEPEVSPPGQSLLAAFRSQRLRRS